MLNLICNLIARIVFTGINGVALIPLLGFLFYIGLGQARDFIFVTNKTFKGGNINAKTSRKMGLH